jgi:hypothetical protein
MRHQEDTTGTRHRAVPPVELYTIVRRKLDILALKAQWVPIAEGIAGRDKDQTLFEDHGAPYAQQIRRRKTSSEMQQARSLIEK